MKSELETVVQEAVQELYGIETAVELSRPEPQFGDYATNVALQLSKKVSKNPREVADELIVKIREKSADKIADVSVAGPGFINLKLSDAALLSATQVDISSLNKDTKLLLEYSCPNAFKELHTGHLYQTVVGDAIGKIFEATGARVYRANFGGDVGLHVAKCLYGITEVLGGENPEKLSSVPEAERAEWLSAAYVHGAKAYEEDDHAKQKINEYNTAVYGFHAQNDHDSPLAQVYWTCREWSYDYFKAFYESIETTPFDKYYPESTTIDRGLGIVREHLGTVFQESEGAVVYDGERHGLHTRVFITSKSLPTYEAKDLGVIYNEVDDFAYDARIIMTGNDQSEYMSVIFAALGEIDRELAAKQNHLANGTVRFGTGQKMSSRLGNVTRAVDVIQEVNNAVSVEYPDTDNRQTALAAIKYSFLRHRLGGDIAFDIRESVSLEGNSGPYLQYAHARARSILRKAEGEENPLPEDPAFASGERLLARKISEFTEIVSKAAAEYMPHHVCTYLYELAQEFNRFYEHNRVLGDERQAVRLQLVARYADTLQSGLALLDIASPEEM
jgi:arginyl-tRNA synthetase